MAHQAFACLLLAALLLAGPAHAFGAIQRDSLLGRLVRRALGEGESGPESQLPSKRWDKDRDNRDTQASAYSSWKGQDPGGPGDAVTYESAESSSTSNYNGNYYSAGTVTLNSGDKAKGGWSGAITKNSPDGPTVAAVATNFDPEFSSQRGVHAVSGTYEGARAVAGSNSFFNAANKNDIGGQAITATIDAYAPTPGDRTNVKDRRSRSVAFTNIAPNSASQSGIGSGPAAIATGYEVAAASRAQRDRKEPPVSLGHRESGKNGAFDTASDKATRKLLLRVSRR